VSVAAAARIVSLPKAVRYVNELAPEVGFSVALRRVAERADEPTARALRRLEDYAGGRADEPVAPELELIATFLRHAPDKERIGAGVTVINAAAAEARDLAAAVRAGMPADFYYSGVLLAVAALVATIWFVYIAPEFTQLFAQFGARLPPFSQALVDAPWLVFGGIAVLAAVLALLVVGTRRVARVIEVQLPFDRAWLGRLLGTRVASSYEAWRASVLVTAWVAAGRDVGAALADALPHGAPARAELEEELALAGALGLARHESAHQLQARLAALAAALEGRRALAARLMQIAVALVVGAIVIAIYLPIFQMGAVI
jgi:type IV pilus assembly protein PilC